MADRQAAEARRVAEEFQPVGGRTNMEYAVPGTVAWCSRARVALRNAATALDALSVRLAQAERLYADAETEKIERGTEIERLQARLRDTEPYWRHSGSWGS